MIESVEYSFTDSNRWVTAVVRGTKWWLVDLDPGDPEHLNEIAKQVLVWINDGNTPALCSTGAKVPPTMQPPPDNGVRPPP